MSTVLDGVAIGGAGGAIAGITVYLVQYLHRKFSDYFDGKKGLNWLKINTSGERGKRYRSTKAIASWTNLTLVRVRYLCSHNKEIYLSTGKEDDMWSIFNFKA